MGRFEDFKDIVAVIQGIVVAVSIPLGGLWALNKFEATHEAETARAALLKAQRDLRERQVLNLKLIPFQSTILGTKSRYVCARLELTNVGNKTEVLYWRDSKFSATHIFVGADGTLGMRTVSGKRVAGVAAADEGVSLLPGEVVHALFLAEADRPGLYYLELDLKPSQSARADSIRDGVEKPALWHTNAHIVVE